MTLGIAAPTILSATRHLKHRTMLFSLKRSKQNRVSERLLDIIVVVVVVLLSIMFIVVLMQLSSLLLLP